MFDSHEIAGLIMLGGLLSYTLLGGADFGGGVWDLLAIGPRAEEQRRVIERAMAPVWEANHVWLIFVIVVLFTAFPLAFSVASIALHVPLTVMLLGIVLRGSAFVFRQYGADASRKNWGRVFAISSLLTPLCLGIVMGAVSEGRIQVKDGIPVSGFLLFWLRLFPFCVGLFTVAVFAYLAAVYLTNETRDIALRSDFRKRALVSWVLVTVMGSVTALSSSSAPAFYRNLMFSEFTIPLVTATALAALGVLWALIADRFRIARVLAGVQVAFIVCGWAVAQYPFLIAPDITLKAAAAPEATFDTLLVVLAAGAVLLIPSIYWMFHVFKPLGGK